MELSIKNKTSKRLNGKKTFAKGEPPEPHLRNPQKESSIIAQTEKIKKLDK